MVSKREIDEALLSVPVTNLKHEFYNIFIAISTAYKVCGGDFDTWNKWCMEDPEAYARMSAASKWKKLPHGGSPEKEFKGLCTMATKYGSYKPKLELEDCSKQSSFKQLIRYLEAVYGPENHIKIITEGTPREDGKWSPSQIFRPVTVARIVDLCQRFESTNQPISDLLPYREEVGVWIGVNPIHASGAGSDKDVSSFENVLLEFDNIPIEEQYAFFIKSDLPIRALTYSGGKSLHAIVRIDADSAEDYKNKVDDLFKWLGENDVFVDQANKNPGRLTRLAGFNRKGQQQTLITTNMGCETYSEWMKKYMKPEFYQINEKGPASFRHDWMAEWIIKSESVTRMNGSIYLYDEKNRVYVSDTTNNTRLRRIIRTYLPNLKQNQVNEVEKYIKDCFTRETEIESGNSRYIAFKNGVFDLDTFQFRNTTKGMHVTSVIPHKYIAMNEIPESDLQAANTYLEEWSDGRDDLQILLGEIIGSCMESRIEDYQRCFLLYGPASTGKSVFLFLIERILGQDNYSSVELASLNDRFSSIHLRDKKANLRSDISHIGLKESNLLKQIITGDTIKGEFKGKDEIFFKPYATLVFSCNSIPNIRDDQGSVARRMIYVPFERVFIPGAKNIQSDLFSERMIEVFISIAIERLKEMKDRGSFTIPESCQELAEETKIMNNSVAAWVNGDSKYMDPNTGEFVSSLVLPDPEVMREWMKQGLDMKGPEYDLKNWERHYIEYCKDHSLTPMQFPRFKAEIETIYGIEWKRVSSRGITTHPYRPYRLKY